MNRSDFLMLNRKIIEEWGRSMTNYTLKQNPNVYIIEPIGGSIEEELKDSWSLGFASSEYDISEYDDRESGVSIRPTIKPRPINVEVQPIELSFNSTSMQSKHRDKPVAYSFKPLKNDIVSTELQSFIPVQLLKIVCAVPENSILSIEDSLAALTPMPLPPGIELFSAIRQRSTPQVPWTISRPAFDSCLTSPMIQPILEDPIDIVKPPKLPKK